MFSSATGVTCDTTMEATPCENVPSAMPVPRMKIGSSSDDTTHIVELKKTANSPEYRNMKAIVARAAGWFDPSLNRALRASQIASIMARTKHPTQSVVFLRQRSLRE